MNADGGAAWDRIRERQPRFPWWAPLAAWVVGAVAVAVAVLVVTQGPGRLDDPDQADQRPGFLVPSDEARDVAGLRLPGDEAGRRPVLLVFDRTAPTPARLQAALAQVPRAFAVVLVVPAPTAAPPPAGVGLLVDPGGRVARAVGLHTPRDGGAPVGYADLDRRGRVRYATIAPAYLGHPFETALIARALL